MPEPDAGWEAQLEWLRRVSLFTSLTPDLEEVLASKFSEVTFPAGASLMSQGDSGDCLFLLTEGSAVVRLRDETGAGQELARVGPGEVVGEMALLTREPRSADVIAEEEIRALRLSAGDFLDLAARFPNLSAVLSKLVSRRFGKGEADALMGKTLAGYQVRRCVGRGGMAIVYEAERLEDGATVALKMMSHDLVYNHNLFQRFQQEADILASLRHPNIAALFGRFSAYGTYFLVMEFCDGRNLEAIVSPKVPIPEALTRRVLGQLAVALGHLHSKGIIHRDVKPSNVMVNLDGTVKLTDFGIARPKEPDGLTKDGGLVGTPIYMSPEQMNGSPVDHHSDIYSLGCLAHFMLSGSCPFLATGYGALLQEKLRFKTPLPDLIQPGLSPEMHEFISRSLTLTPEDRSVDLEALSSWAGPVDLRGIGAVSGVSLAAMRSDSTVTLRTETAETGSLDQRLGALWRRLRAATDPGVEYGRLAARYGEPVRCYHDLSHIRNCLEEFDRVRSLAMEPDLVEVALWFHDAVLEPLSDDNEARSAELAVDALGEAGLDRASCHRVAGMILATRHREGPVEADEGLVADIDLSGLALSPEEFDANTDRIREENRRAGIEDSDPGMFAFLERLIAKEWLYHTTHYRESHEEPARANIARLLGGRSTP